MSGHPVKVWDTALQEWRHAPTRTWQAGAWRRSTDSGGGFTYTTPWWPRYLGEGTVWQRDVSQMPLATHSADHANWMATHVNYGTGFGKTAFNTSVSGTHSIQCYVVDSTLPDCNYQHIDGNFGTDPYFVEIMRGWVPWPAWAFVPQPGQDSGLAIFDVGTGILREYYFVARVAGTDNRWSCMTGGYSIAPRRLKNWAAQNYATRLDQGSHAVVGMHNHLGFVGLSEARAGKVNHALAYTCSNMAVPDSSGEGIRPDGTRYSAVGPSWPAKAGDGDTANPDDLVPIHGQWARLPKGIDLTPYRSLTRVLIQAAQDYGLIATDSNNFVHAFNGEPGFAEQHFFGVDPWSTSGDVYRRYDALDVARGLGGGKPLDVGDFPWHLTEWAPRNWGAPE